MNNGTEVGILITIFGLITWLRGIYVNRNGYKTRGEVVGFEQVTQRDPGTRSYRTQEYPTVVFTDVDGIERQQYVKHLITKADRPKIGDQLDILIHDNMVYSGHDISTPFFLYLGLLVVVISLFF